MNYKKQFLKTIFISAGLSILCMLIFIAPLFMYDPLQTIYNRPYNTNLFTKNPNMRLQARGIIDKVPFDNVVLGTSMLENTSAIEASKILGGSFVNLSLSGSNFFERAFVLKYLLRHKNINNIIYSFDLIYLSPTEGSSQLDHWELLYDDFFLNDLIVLLDKKYIKQAYQERAKTLQNKQPLSTEKVLDTPNEWMTNKDHSCRFGGLQNWISNLEKQGIAEFLLKTLPNTLKNINPPQRSEFQTINIDNAIKHINKYILNFVEQNPQTQFNIILPPYYRYQYATWRQLSESKTYFIHQEIIKFMVSKTEKYKNLHIYGFEDQDFLDNIENYKDTGHYHSDINSYMTQAISKGMHLLTPHNIQIYLEECEKRASNFDIKKLYEDSQKILRAQGKPTTWEDYQLQ